jgi:lysophospholipase-3
MIDPLISHRLKHDPVTGQYSNNDGVDIRVPDFGGTSSIEYLDPSIEFFPTTNYFHDMVQWFVDKGYTRGKDIVGAPYDWRYSPSKLFFKQECTRTNLILCALLHKIV